MDDNVVIRFVGKDDVTDVAKKVNKSVESTGKSANKATGGVEGLNDSFGQLADIVSGAGYFAAAKQFYDIGIAAWDASVNAALFYDKMKLVQDSIGVMLKSKVAGDALFATMKDIAARTPFTFQDIAGATQALVAMGFEAGRIPSLLNTIGNVATATGTGAEGVMRITRALGQMQAKGKITTEEMTQLQEMGIPAFKLLAQATGVSEEALRDMVSRGLVPAATNLDTLINAMKGNYGEVMAQQMNTATVAQSNLVTATDNLKVAIGKATSPAVIGGYVTAAKYVDLFAAAVSNANQKNNKLAIDQLKARNADLMWWRDFASKIHLPGIMNLVSSVAFESGIAANNSAIQELTNSTEQYGNGAMIAARAQDTLTGKIAVTPLVINDQTDSIKKSTSASDENTDALRAQEEATRRIEEATRSYDDHIKNLSHSYLDIADAQRSLESAQKALADAQDPARIQEMTLAIRSQELDMRDLNESMAEMKTRREEIAKALAGMNDAQIKQNALSAQEHARLNQLNESLSSLKKRRDAVRKALAGDNLTAEQRMEFMQTEAALTASINQQTGEKADLNKKQQDALTAAAAERVKLLEEDKQLQKDLERSQIRVQESILAMSQSQKALAEAQDPKRLEAYRDAVTKAQIHLNELRTEQEADKIAADQLAASLGITSGATDTLRQSALETATPLDDIAARTDTISESVGGLNGTNAVIATLSGNMTGLGTDSDAASAGLGKVETALKKIKELNLSATLGTTLQSIGTGVNSIADANVKFTTDYLSAPLGAVKAVAEALKQAEATAFTDWATALTNAVNAATDTTKVKQLINSLVALQNATNNTTLPLPYDLTQRQGSASRSSSLNVQSTPANSQNITIHLHYASPPSSKTPLKDVEDYLAAQGGRLRI